MMPALARSGHLAAQDASFLVLQLILLKERLHTVSGNIKTGLDNALRSSYTNGFHIGTLSQQQTDGTQNNGFSTHPVSPVITEKPLSKRISKLWESSMCSCAAEISVDIGSSSFFIKMKEYLRSAFLFFISFCVFSIISQETA